jgi:ankyrin repeat protein
MDLYEAARQGSNDEIESAVDEGFDVNTRDKDGKTLLWSAVQGGHSDTCKILIARGARVEEQIPDILEFAVQREHIDIVKLLWPHCKVERQHRCLETAISLGFHGIADFLVGTQEFEYQHSKPSDIEMLMKDGFSGREIAAFQHWERFIFVRQSEKLNLHRVFFDYALLLATKADGNVGLRLVNLLLEGEKPLANANCKININGEVETPLTNAAEKGNLEILAALIKHPHTKLMICGKYDWPAFLHLLASSESISSEKGRAIARTLSKQTFPDSFLIDDKEARLETVLKNVLQLGDDALVNQVIDLVQGAAGISILPLLIRANVTNGSRLISNNVTARASKPPPILWVLLCNFFQRNPSSEAWKLFVQVAEFLVKKAIWDPMILVCLNSRNFAFVKHLFYPLDEVPPREVAEETLRGVSQVSTDQSLVRMWVDKGFANAALWSAIRSGIWRSPAFENLLSFPHIDLDGPFPREQSSDKGETNNNSPPVSVKPTGEKRKFPFSQPAGGPQKLPVEPVMAQNHAYQDYQMQLMLLEQQKKRRLMMAWQEQMNMTMGKGSPARRVGTSPLAWAVANRNVKLVEVLLRSLRVNVNSQDAYYRTPLMHAIAVNHCQIVETLLGTRDIDLNLRDDEGRTAVFYAAQTGDLHVIQLLTETNKVEFSIRDCNGESVQDIAKNIGKQDVLAALPT